jgi:hypothetical protein
MYILIDRGQMAITHKHSSREVLSGLSWIECTNAGGIYAVGSVRALSDFTPAELALIYKNATGADFKGYANTLAHVVMSAAKRMPETLAKVEEVRSQMSLVGDGDKSCYKYVYGAMKPEHINGVFTPDPIMVERVEAEEVVAASAAPAYTHTASAGRAVTPANSTGAAREPRAPSAPRTGGARDTIFKVADEMWLAAGNPKAIPAVLALRKQIMIELELNHGVKKTTSSTALGDWQKTRVL